MHALERLIDANANRAREGLRVLEDVARFVLGDEALAAAAKDLRHGVARALASPPLDRLALVASRDAAGDVGANLEGALEGARDGVGSLVAANAARVGEALRALEEATKVVAPVVAPALERARYDFYEFDRRLTLRVGAGGARRARLCVIIGGALCRDRPWERVAELCLEGGADWIQLREKSLPDRELLARTRRLVAMARGAGSRPLVFVNDRIDVALLAGADGVHLGQGDVSIDDARRVAGGRLLVGVSTHSLDQALVAAAAGADAIGVGPMFANATKPQEPVVGPDALAPILSDPRTSGIAHLAIGGIDAERAAALARRGWRGVAVASAVCGAERPDEACRNIRRAMEQAGAPAPDDVRR